MVASRGVSSLAGVCAMLSILSLLTLLLPAANGQLIDCYRWDGSVVANNTRCPGSNACCGIDSTCLSNRLCTPVNDRSGNTRPVRGPCAVQEWDGSCPQICLYDERGRFPRVETCEDGSLCCNDDPNCCERGVGIFLDEDGRRVSTRATGAITSYPPTAGGVSRYTLLPSASVDSSAATTGGADSATTSEAAPTPTATSSNTAPGAGSPIPSETPSTNSGDSLGLKVGLGVGIPVAVIATALLMWFLLRRRRQPHDASGPRGLIPGDEMAGEGPYKYMESQQTMGAQPTNGFGNAPELAQGWHGGAAPYQTTAFQPTEPQHNVAAHPMGTSYSTPTAYGSSPPDKSHHPYVAELGGQMAAELNVPTPVPHYAAKAHELGREK